MISTFKIWGTEANPPPSVTEFPPDSPVPRYQRGLIKGFEIDQAFTGRGLLADACAILRPGGYAERFRDRAPLHSETWAFVADYYATAQFNKEGEHFDTVILELIATDARSTPKARTLASEALIRHLGEQASKSLIHADQVRALISRLGGILQSLSTSAPL